MALAAAAELAGSLAGELEEVEVEGSRAWLLAADTAGPWEPPDGSVRLLPHFDCYLRGSHPRDVLVPPAVRQAAAVDGHARQVLTGPLPALVVDGAVAGVWERRTRGRILELRVRPYLRLGAARRRQLDAEAARMGRILAVPVELTIGELTTRPHL
jgi:hypothetical protein